MTRIRNILFRSNRRSSRAMLCRHNNSGDSVSFDSFYNESSPEKAAIARESTLVNNENLSPKNLNKCEEYLKISKDMNEPTCRPSVPVMILLLMMISLFLILPIIYVLHFFGVIYPGNMENNFKHIHLNDMVPYESSQKIHNEPNQSKAKSLPPPPKPDYNECKLLKDGEKYDCFPQGSATAEACEARGCCWLPPTTAQASHVKEVPLNTPYCFYQPNFPSYKYLNVTAASYGVVAYLQRVFKSPYPDDVEVLKIVVKYETNTRLHIKILDPLKNRFEPPYPEVPIVDRAAFDYVYKLIMDPSKTGFKIVRKDDGTTIFDATELSNFIFADQFLQISAKLPSSNIYGLGEHRSDLLLSTMWSRFTLFNHDSIPSFNKNLYGSHPLYMVVENAENDHKQAKRNAHGVFLLNSNAMDIILQPAPAITFRTIGGILDFYYFLGPTPRDVVQQYTELVGRPTMPPYWGLGFHLCRFGYKTLEQTKKIMNKNIDAGIPLDTQWNDLDYMNNSNDFTYDKTHFSGLPKFIDDLHKNGMHYIPLIDAGVSASEKDGTYPPFDVGVKMDIFVKNSSGQTFIGKVWNKGTTAWPDFTHPDTVGYWTQMLMSLHNQIPFDGAWIDMNEPSNFLNGATTGCTASNLETPPYLPNIDGGSLNYKTMCMSSKHYAGLHYDVHNLFGFTEAIATSFAMAEIRRKRPMIISRSSFAGLGKYSGHWSGDVVSDWLDMKYSIPQLLMYSIFGVPLMGADICGFNGNATASLCNRWMQLGAFYPFARNHNTDDGINQDPASMGEQVIASSKKALNIRYSLLPYLYTLFWKAHADGDTVARPLFFEFPYDVNTFGIDTQFLWGPAFLIIPVLNENALSVKGYLPAGYWYDFYTKEPIKSKGEYFNISAPIDTIPLFIRGGFILPQQSPAQTTTAARKSKVEILAALDNNVKASGELYWDDGDSLNTYEEKQYSLTSFELEENVLRISNVFRSEIPPNLGRVTLMGIWQPVTMVSINDAKYEPFMYDKINKYLLIDKLDLPLDKEITIAWK